MVKQALEAFGPRGFTHLADLTEKRTCRFASAAVYVDARGELHTFADDSRKPGSIASAPDRRDGPRSWSDLWSIFVPEGATSTLAALPPADQEQVFAEWRAQRLRPRQPQSIEENLRRRLGDWDEAAFGPREIDLANIQGARWRRCRGSRPVIGGYVLHGRLGAGGMGEVFLGRSCGGRRDSVPGS
jgi:hypothetical protein